MAFGDGGVDQNGTPLETTGNEVQLRSELLRKAIIGYAFEAENTTCTYTASLQIHLYDFGIKQFAAV